MRTSFVLMLGLCLAAVSPSPAAAQSSGPFSDLAVLHAMASPATAGQSPAPVAFEYSEGYKTRAKIHKYASFATLPLFATEVALGQATYNEPSGAQKGAHVAVGATIGGLFAVNTVTGAWNLWEARKDPHKRKLRWVHGLLMMAANAGFVATAAVAPDNDAFDYNDQRRTHRAVALTSIGVATVGYLTMFIGNR
jgi:hypothetical protein